MIAVPIRYRRAQKGLFLQKLQHAVPSIVVLGDGIDHLSHGAEGLDLWLGVAEVGVSVLVIGSVIRGFRELRKEMARSDHDVHPHHGVDWIDICLGVMLSVEAYAKYHATAHIPRPTILLAFAMLAIGVLHGKIAKKGDEHRELRVGAEGISVPGRPFSRLTLKWEEVASIDVDDPLRVDHRARWTHASESISATCFSRSRFATRCRRRAPLSKSHVMRPTHLLNPRPPMRSIVHMPLHSPHSHSSHSSHPSHPHHVAVPPDRRPPDCRPPAAQLSDSTAVVLPLSSTELIFTAP